MMYGLIGRMTAVPGKRDELVACLAGGTGDMPGCLSYIVALDTGDDDAIWVTEVWTDRESHEASLSLPAVQETIVAGRPLIAGFDRQAVTHPVSGIDSGADTPR